MSAPASDVHTVPLNGAWVNKVGARQVGDRFPTQEAAVAAGRELAMQGRAEHVIHGSDGKIREKNSYGHDPREIPG